MCVGVGGMGIATQLAPGRSFLETRWFMEAYLTTQSENQQRVCWMDVGVHVSMDGGGMEGGIHPLSH